MLIAVSRVTSQGQISVPAEVRRRLNVRPGTELVWDLGENGEMVVRPKRCNLEDVQGILNAPGLPQIRAKVAEIKAARQELWAGRHGRR